MSRNSNRLLYKYQILKRPVRQTDEEIGDELDALAREFNGE